MDQSRNLFEGAGFDHSRVIDTPSSIHIVDGLPPQGWGPLGCAGPSPGRRSTRVPRKRSTLRPA